MASNVGSLILVALIITVRSAQHGLAVLLSVGPDGVDLPGAACAPMSRDSMQKHVDKQTSAFLGTEMTTFLAFEKNSNGPILRCYACPLEYDTFHALGTGAQWVADAAQLACYNYDKDNPARQLVLAPVCALRGLSCEQSCLEAMAAVDTMRGTPFQPLSMADHTAHDSSGSSASTTMGPYGRPSKAWRLRVRLHEASQNLVRLQLRAAAHRLHRRDLKADADELVASADRVGVNKVTDVDDIPFELRGPDDAIADHAWRHERFSSVLEAPVTPPLPQAQPQQQVKWRPSTVEDLFMPGVWAKVAV